MEERIKRLQSLFGGLDRAYGEYRIDEENLSDKLKKGGKAVTVSKPHSADNWRLHLEGKVGFGMVPIREDGTCSWACVDVDAYGKDVTEITNTFVQEYGLPFVIMRSKSGGAHVCIFFKEPVPAKLVVKKMAAFASSMGFDGAEIFPKQTHLEPDQFGNWLNMPYFDWEISTRYGLDPKGKRLDLDAFLDFAESRKISFDAWKALEVPSLEHPFSDGPPCLQALARQKVDEGGRNNAMLQFGVYAKQKYGEDWQDKLQEYNHSYFVEALPLKEMNNTIFKSLNRKDYGYKCTDQPMASVCNRSACLRRKFGVGGADLEFEAEMQLNGLRKLIYFAPDGDPLDDDPEWELSVQGRAIRFTTAQLTDQVKFGIRCMNKLSILPNRIANNRWLEIVREQLQTCETVEIPFETSPVADTLERLKEYLDENSHARTVLELLNGLALKKDSCYRFRLEALVEYMRQKTRALVDKKEVAEHLKSLGLSRKETTARDKDAVFKVIYWEIEKSQLEIYAEQKPDAPTVEF